MTQSALTVSTAPVRLSDDMDRNTAIRNAAFAHVRRLTELRDSLTAKNLAAGFQFEGMRIPVINPQRGIFKPMQMQLLLSIETVFPKPGGRVWYDDQREVHQQIFAGVDTISYAFMGTDPDAADESSRGAPRRHTPLGLCAHL